MTSRSPQGDLARTTSQESNDDWPTLIEIAAYFGPTGRKGRRRSVQIPADRFFGRGTYGAPMDGHELIGIIDRLRRSR